MSSIDNKLHNDTKDNEDNSGNKRQKLDNGGEIDITDLDKKTVVQLNEIAISLGISVNNNNTKTDEIIEKIKAIHKRKQDTLAKQEINSNLNSFNKGIIEFTIKDGIDGSEWLLWNVFRNKFIYKRIMSFMDKKLTPEYNSIISVADMVENNQVSMLRDKVIRNQYLVFDISSNTNFHFFSIFKTFRNNDDQDRLFYQHLFKYYGKYILEFNATKDKKGGLILDGTNNRELLFDIIIKSRCLPALQILIQQYQYKPTELNLSTAIDEGAIKFIKLILQYQPQLKESIHKKVSSIKIYSSSSVNNTINLATIKSLYWLIKERLIYFKTNANLNNITVQLIQTTKHQINETISLKLLISICKILLSTSNVNTNSNIEEIESFSNSLTKQELKLPLSDPSFQIQYKKDNILKLLDCYYSNTNFEPKPEFYYLYFRFNGIEYGQTDDNQVIFSNDKSNQHTQFKQSLQFANFTLFKHCFNENAVSAYSIDYISKLRSLPPSNIPLLFSHCSGEINKGNRLKFINTLIKNNKDNINNNQEIESIFKSPNISIPSFQLLLLLIDYDDLELVKLFSTTMKLNELSYKYSNFKVNQFIKSIEMLEYVYGNYNQLFDNTINISIWQFKSVQLLQCYESLVSGNMIFVDSVKMDTSFSFILNNSPNEIIRHVIEKGPSVYTFNSKNGVFLMINAYCKTENEKFQLMTLLFNNFQYHKQ